MKGLDSLSRRGGGSPYVIDEDGQRSLHFDGPTIQSQMAIDAPDMLALDYTRAMMGFLLFHPRPRHILMIGLGGGSIAKYCLRTLPDTRFTAVEISPEVIALRDAFGIPPDGPRLRIVCADGADYVRDCADAPDVLLVDGFDRGGQPAPLCSADFYARCRGALAADGVMAVNLWSGDRRYGVYASRLRECFDERIAVVRTDDSTNRIVFACKGDPFPPPPKLLQQRAHALEATHPIGLGPLAQQVQYRLDRRKLLRPDLWLAERLGQRG